MDQPGYGKPGRWSRQFGGSVPVKYAPPPPLALEERLRRIRQRALAPEPLRAERRRAMRAYAKANHMRARDVWAFYQAKKQGVDKEAA